jgi:glycosyltransferase involved in cell wall biosynthesis
MGVNEDVYNAAIHITPTLTLPPQGGGNKAEETRPPSRYIRRAFADDPATRVRRIYEFRTDLRQAMPLALTPVQRGPYLEWLITHGCRDFDITPEAAVWFHFEQDEDPSRGLIASYRLHPEWQAAVPHGITRFGWPKLKQWVMDRYDVRSRWIQRAEFTPQFRPWEELLFLFQAEPKLRDELPSDPHEIPRWAENRPSIAKHINADWLRQLAHDCREQLPTQLSANVIGLFRYTSGLQQAVKSTVAALRKVEVRLGLRDFPVLYPREPRTTESYDSLEPFDITIINSGMDIPVPEAYAKSGVHRRPGVHRIGIWWWELEDLPPGMRDRANDLDEIWAPTNFIAEAMRKAYAKPVYTMNPGVELSAFEPRPKDYFGLDPARFTFNFVFDMGSRMQRKNPLGLIAAFRKAFAPSDPVQLAIKVSTAPPPYFQDQLKLLKEAVASTPNVKLLDVVYTRPDLLALMNATDCYVSLHRSEGLGLTCAEAMLLGKPTIATRYSGNLDFMTEENSYLVDSTRIALEENIDPYPKGAVWAEPSIAHAAEVLRRVFEDRDEAHAKGERAKRDLQTNLSLRASGQRMRERLEQIRREHLRKSPSQHSVSC